MIPQKMNSLKMLQDKDYAAKRRRYVNVPESAITRTKFSDSTANGLTKCIVTWLDLHNCYATRVNTQGRLLRGKEFTDILGHRKQMRSIWTPGTTKTGTADIHAVIKGRHISIEVKIGKDRMSPDQHKTKQAIEQAGGLYWVVSSFEIFMNKFNLLNQ